MVNFLFAFSLAISSASQSIPVLPVGDNCEAVYNAARSAYLDRAESRLSLTYMLSGLDELERESGIKLTWERQLVIDAFENPMANPELYPLIDHSQEFGQKYQLQCIRGRWSDRQIDHR